MQYHIVIPIKTAKILALSDYGEYQKRLQNRLQIMAMKDTAQILSKIPQMSGAIWAFDKTGTMISSEDLSVEIRNARLEFQAIYCLIGGADGLGAPILQSAHKVFSLGKITLPHAMMPLILSEQIYRAESILNNSPYHLGH